MNAGVNASFEALNNFHDHLVRFDRALAGCAESSSVLHTHWRDVADVRPDGTHDDLGQALEELQVGIRRYLIVAEAHEEYLLRLAERLQAFVESE